MTDSEVAVPAAAPTTWDSPPIEDERLAIGLWNAQPKINYAGFMIRQGIYTPTQYSELADTIDELANYLPEIRKRAATPIDASAERTVP